MPSGLPSLPGGLVLVIAVLGAANGMATLARATTLAELFGPAHYATISGAVALGANGARALGPVGAAVLYTLLGGYRPVFWLLYSTHGMVCRASSEWP